jgi:hypothetical protein
VRQLRRDEWMLVNSVENAMSAIFHKRGIQTVHDQVVSEVAQRWAKAYQCRVTINIGLEQNPWADPKQQSDIVGWHVHPLGNSMEWIAEIETEDSLSDPDVRTRWEQVAVPGISYYLLIPKGKKAAAEKLATASAIRFNGIYEYSFFNKLVQIL